MTREFQTVGSTLRDLIREKVGPIETSVLDLQTLPETDTVLRDLDSARMHAAALKASQFTARPQQARADAALKDQERRYEDAVRRDALQSERPLDCWCLGAGGGRPRYLPIPTGGTFLIPDGTSAGREANEIAEIEVYGAYCECADGQARRERDDVYRRQYSEDRQRRLILRRFGEAKLPPEYRDYPWRDHPDRGAIARVIRWLDTPKTERDSLHWLLIFGDGGRGKTTVLAGMAAELAAAGRPVLFRVMPELLADIRATWGDREKEAELISILQNAPWLFLDDLGAEAPREWVGEILYTILNYRHNHHLATVANSNLPPEELVSHLGERLWGRFKRMAEPVEMGGPDLRNRA